jgi:hypothetical protein
MYERQEIGPDLMNAVLEQWSIYRNWERQSHTGQVTEEAHPGKGGIDARYDELEAIIRKGVGSLEPARVVATGEFRPISHQPKLPKGCLPELEVQWQPQPPNTSLERTRER